MSGLIRNTRFWLIVCLGALGLTILLSLLAHVAGPGIWGDSPEEMRAAGRVMLPIFFGLFLVLGFSALPLAANLFVAGLETVWASAGLLERPLHAKIMTFLRRHQVHFVLAVWAMYLAGLLIAAPYIIADLK
jgi:hypothetical protein